MADLGDLLAWAVLARTPGLNVARVSAMLAHFGSAAAVLAAGERQGLSELAPASATFLSSAAARPRSIERDWLNAARHHLLPCTHPEFPAQLRELPDCPLALYVCGDVRALREPQLAIVGSRNPSPQGLEDAEAFAEGLGERGLTITSGAAEGIDSAAHRGGMRAQGLTIGVLGTGIDGVYPPGNRLLFNEIAGRGALISEFPLGTPPRRSNFPRRNRIIAGIALGTLVVEAARRSGSLITARLAGDYGREVFAIPGSIHNPLSRGCHELIKAGAKLVETIDDILSELNFSAFFAKHLASPTRHGADSHEAVGMDKDRKILLDALGFDPVDLDTLVVRSGFKPEAVSSMILILELEGHVQAAPGGRYSRVANRRAGVER